jgi:hypothetical protein
MLVGQRLTAGAFDISFRFRIVHVHKAAAGIAAAHKMKDRRNIFLYFVRQQFFALMDVAK